MKVPVIYFSEEDADSAFRVLRALESIERENPDFVEWELWQDMRRKARDRFASAFMEKSK